MMGLIGGSPIDDGSESRGFRRLSDRNSKYSSFDKIM